MFCTGYAGLNATRIARAIVGYDSSCSNKGARTLNFNLELDGEDYMIRRKLLTNVTKNDTSYVDFLREMGEDAVNDLSVKGISRCVVVNGVYFDPLARRLVECAPVQREGVRTLRRILSEGLKPRDA